jgi:hypothetical protein
MAIWKWISSDPKNRRRSGHFPTMRELRAASLSLSFLFVLETKRELRPWHQDGELSSIRAKAHSR